MNNVELVFAARDEVGEGPLWHAEEQALYWVDNETTHFHRLRIPSSTHELFDVGEKIGVIALRKEGGLVIATNHGFSFFDLISQRLDRIGDPEADKPETQFNDGKVDRSGRFWAGTMGDANNNSLYRLDSDGVIHQMDTGFDICNGIGWSPDNQSMYFVDSTPRYIYTYDFNLERGEIENRRVFVDRSTQRGVPDGLTVDAEGFVWVAIWDGACVERYDPDGRLERTIPLPVQFPTSVMFGDENLENLYITSALYEIPQEERGYHPLDGNLLRICGIGNGIEEPKFAG
jgi:sugar lactone lactonase YvrE